MKTIRSYSVLSLLILFVSISELHAAGHRYPFEVKVSGHGNAAMLFLPGFACSGAVWDETLPHFEKNYTCYTFTMAGFAGTQAADSISFNYWKSEIAAYIRENKILNPIIVGHSMGGGLALAVAADFPDCAGKVVVVDALPCLAALMDPTFKAQDSPDCSAFTGPILSSSEEDFFAMQKQAASRLTTDPGKQDLIVQWSMKTDRRTFAEMYCDFSNTDLREKIGSIQCPVLVLLEAYFKNLQPAIASQYAALPHAKLEYAGKGLHFIMFDDKEWYLSALTSFTSGN